MTRARLHPDDIRAIALAIVKELSAQRQLHLIVEPAVQPVVERVVETALRKRSDGKP